MHHMSCKWMRYELNNVPTTTAGKRLRIFEMRHIHRIFLYINSFVWIYMENLKLSFWEFFLFVLWYIVYIGTEFNWYIYVCSLIYSIWYIVYYFQSGTGWIFVCKWVFCVMILSEQNFFIFVVFITWFWSSYSLTFT